jgi:hypothetical protein
MGLPFSQAGKGLNPQLRTLLKTGYIGGFTQKVSTGNSI